MRIFSLPTQRCFRQLMELMPKNLLFSAYAEVFPSNPRFRHSSHTFLCLRRGVSGMALGRCFMRLLFSAYAEVFLLNKPVAVKRSAFLCLRRGVSVVVKVSSDGTGFSLPTQRCFRRTRHCDDARRLFSAYAEVFLKQNIMMHIKLSFLCLRRGVSASFEIT